MSFKDRFAEIDGEPKEKKKKWRDRRAVDVYGEFFEQAYIPHEEDKFPKWYIDRRQELLDHLKYPEISVIRRLKCRGIKFFIKYPVEIDGKWKFLDIFVPENKIAVIVDSGQKQEELNEKWDFFSQRFKVFELACNAPDMEYVIDYILTRQKQ